MLVRVHAGVADVPAKIRGKPSKNGNEINQMARASELIFGSSRGTLIRNEFGETSFEPFLAVTNRVELSLRPGVDTLFPGPH
jgi:hypothetical protein